MNTLKKYIFHQNAIRLKKVIFMLMVLFFMAIAVHGQAPLRDYLLTQAIYNDTFAVTDSHNEDSISKILMSRDLNQWLTDSLINRDNMRDFALPLGVFKRPGKVNFVQGMNDMWRAKAYYINARTQKTDSRIFLTATNATDAMLREKQSTDLRAYREFVISPAVADMHQLHNKLKPLYSEDRAIFMSLISEHITPNVMLGFNIQELLPPTHQTADGSIRRINPLFKACFLDRILREAGSELIRYYPSRFDLILSYGPFQITPVAIADIQLNNRLSDDFKKYQSFDDLEKLEDHVALATLFAYNNWERLSYLLQSDSTIHKFNNYFADADENDDKKRQLQIFVAGMTACMHHHPPNTNKMIRDWINVNEDLSRIHYECIAQKGNKQLQKYYRSSAEAFLLMKVYHILADKYDTEPENR